MKSPPIGTVVEAKEDDHGLWFKARLPKDDTFVRDRIAPQVKNRGLKSLSIGFKTRRSSKKDGARLLEKLDLFEISLVNMPMNEAARVTGFKGVPLDKSTWFGMSPREREDMLRDEFGVSNDLAKYLAAGRDGRGDDGAERDVRATKSLRDAGNREYADLSAFLSDLKASIPR